MVKIDYKKELKNLYSSSAEKVEVVELPQMNFLMIDGEGDPNTSQSFQDAIDVLHHFPTPSSLSSKEEK